MRIVVPAVPGKLHPIVVTTMLQAGAPSVEVVALDAEEGYFRLFVSLWEAGEDFMLVEHDIEIHQDTITAMETCPELWCAHSYPVYWGNLWEHYGVPGLGCVRFRAELIAQHPELVDMLATYEVPDHPPRHWMTLDGAVAQILRGPFQHTPHRHHPDVLHHHAYQYEGAYLPDDVRATLPAGHPLELPADHPLALARAEQST